MGRHWPAVRRLLRRRVLPLSRPCRLRLDLNGKSSSDQDLVCSRGVGAADAGRRGPVASSTTAKAAASTPTWVSRGAPASTKAPVPAGDADEAATAASSKIWEGAAAPSGAARGAKWTGAITTGAGEATSTAPTTASHTRAAHGDLQGFARGQVEVPADQRTSPSPAPRLHHHPARQ
jgi:hypothetical protein